MRLQELSDEAGRAFLRDPAKNRYDAATRTLRFSAIFDWFRADFERSAKSLPAFISTYVDKRTAEAMRADATRIEFLDYDWSLNGR